MEARRAEARARLNERQAAAKAAAQARLKQRRPTKEGRWRWWMALLALLILLLLLSRCACVEEPTVEEPPPPPPTPASGELVEPEPAPPEGPPPPPVNKIDRPSMESEPAPALPWLDAFRLQVSARSPRLAQCFVGADRPGRLRWRAAVEPGRGLVSEQQVEPMLIQDALTNEQKDCVVAVLADPPYQLDPGDGPSTPSRVSMVIEF